VPQFRGQKIEREAVVNRCNAETEKGCAAFRLGFPTSSLLDFYGAGEDNGGRGTDSPGAPTLTTPKVLYRLEPFLPPNQQRQSTEG